MDPDQCLNEIRDLYEALINPHLLPRDKVAGLADELGEKVNALDVWLTQGGYRPTEWIHN